MSDIIIKTQTRAPKGSHKGRQQGHHRAVGKYTRQRMRTEANKLRAWKRHKANHPKDLPAQKFFVGVL